MRRFPSLMLDRPETPTVAAAAGYAFLSFVSFPFILLLLMTGSFDEPKILAGCQMFYYLCNFVVVLLLFRGYLAESFMNVQLNKQTMISSVAISVGVMVGLAVVWHYLFNMTGSQFVGVIAYGSLPVSEMEILTLCSNVVYEYPLLGTLFLVLIVPVTTSCLYYAVGFAPVCCERPWLAYIIVAVVIAVPRVVNALTFWNPTEELALYIAQLPIHLLACRAYQKSDTVWAPIFCLMAANLLACLFYIVTYAMFAW